MNMGKFTDIYECAVVPQGKRIRIFLQASFESAGTRDKCKRNERKHDQTFESLFIKITPYSLIDNRNMPLVHHEEIVEIATTSFAGVIEE